MTTACTVSQLHSCKCAKSWCVCVVWCGVMALKSVNLPLPLLSHRHEMQRETQGSCNLNSKPGVALIEYYPPLTVFLKQCMTSLASYGRMSWHLSVQSFLKIPNNGESVDKTDEKRETDVVRVHVDQEEGVTL